MPEGRVADVVNQGQRLYKLRAEAQSGGHGAGNLSDFKGVGEAVAKVIGKAGGKDLGFGLKAAKGAGMHDAVAVASVFTAVAVGGFGKTPPARSGRVHSPGCVDAKRFADRNLRGLEEKNRVRIAVRWHPSRGPLHPQWPCSDDLS